MNMFTNPSSERIAQGYKKISQVPKFEGFVDPLKEWKPSPWAGEVSGVRKMVNGDVAKAVEVDVEPAPKLPPIFMDQSVIDAFQDYNFNDLTTTREDVRKWMDPITINKKWLAQYNEEMGFDGTEGKNKITIEEVQKNPHLRKIIAQFALHDKADEFKQNHGPRPVAYNDIPFKRPMQPTCQSTSQIHMPWSKAERAANPVEKPTLGSKIKSGFSWIGKKLSKLFS